jgi:cytosine/adenosine deaminase-related metal-dependent hydrolase
MGMDIKPILDDGREPLIHRAGWMMINPDTVIQNGYVRVEMGRVVETGVFHHAIRGKVVDHGPDLLMPAFVNAHTHLELSALKGKLAFGGGFGAWVRDLLVLRESIGFDGLVAGIETGVNELVNSGSLVVGDVSTLGIVESRIKGSSLSGLFFREYLGNSLPELAEIETGSRFTSSYAGHAPHTTSPSLLKHLKETCRRAGQVFSVHLAESSDEMEFITTGKGMWADFLKERAVDYVSWGLPFKSPVAYLDSLVLLDEQTLAVHLIRADKQDIRILKERRVPVCICLRSNQNLHKTLPDLESMINEGLLICLGTDSLASTESLSILDEMRYLAEAFPQVSAKAMVRMATINGAKALGLEKVFGSLEPGKMASMVYIPLSAKTEQSLFENILL